MPDPTIARRSEILAELARPADLRALRLPVLHVVMTLRLCALFERAGREPLGELSTRFASVTAARALLDLSHEITAAWPEPYTCARPCCMGMTPDEITLAALVRAALHVDRAGFALQLDGLIKPNLHERIYQACLAAVAHLPRP